jgi:hypothetical protein
MRFTDRSQADQWRHRHQNLLMALNMEASAVEGVSYAETWLCGGSPSFVAGFDEDDQMVVCLPIRSINK